MIGKARTRAQLGKLLLLGMLLAWGSGLQTVPADTSVTSLLEVRTNGAPGSFLLVCDGTFLFSRVEEADPSRLVLDLQNVRNGMQEDHLRVESELVREISIGASGSDPSGTRVVFELTRPVPVSLHPGGETLEVLLNPEPSDGTPVVGEARPARVLDAPVPSSADYIIGREDLLEVSVFQQPDLDRTVRVTGEGTIRLPLVGKVSVNGLTTQEAETKLRDLLEAKYLNDPQVSIFLKEARSKKISVLGAVKNPGTVEMLGQRTLLEALSETGGLTQESGKELYVLRPDASGATTRIDVDLDDLMINGNPELNIPILPGDVINVPIDRILHVYVDGAVQQPGEIEFKASRPLSLLQAIAAAGGLSERAAQKGIMVIRMHSDGTQEQVKINLKAVRKGKEPNLILMPGDSVYVPETFF